MSTAPTQASPAPPGTPAAKREITLVSHSMLFYWWPIWLTGFLFAAITGFEDNRLAIVPAGSTVAKDTALSEPDKNITAYIVKVKEDPNKTPNASLKRAERAQSTPDGGDPFKTRVSQKSWMGPLFCVILLLTVVITNVPLRGLWSFLVLLMLCVLALIITIIPGGWDSLLGAVGNLHIYINMAGYLFIAVAVVILWTVSVFIFDKRTYMRITPGQIQVCEHIGASIRNFDTFG
ncbi:MAG TPA: hypothetical protein VLM40_03425, partial [Gemmata sp.]|nr:hypothetical protein [Gemmata sp.]